jgi:hypothetical protein
MEKGLIRSFRRPVQIQHVRRYPSGAVAVVNKGKSKSTKSIKSTKSTSQLRSIQPTQRTRTVARRRLPLKKIKFEDTDIVPLGKYKIASGSDAQKFLENNEQWMDYIGSYLNRNIDEYYNILFDEKFRGVKKYLTKEDIMEESLNFIEDFQVNDYFGEGSSVYTEFFNDWENVTDQELVEASRHDMDEFDMFHDPFNGKIMANDVDDPSYAYLNETSLEVVTSTNQGFTFPEAVQEDPEDYPRLRRTMDILTKNNIPFVFTSSMNATSISVPKEYGSKANKLLKS